MFFKHLLTPLYNCLGLQILAFIGAVITYHYPESCYYFWLFMCIALGAASVGSVWSERPSVLKRQVFHWLGAFFGIVMVYAYHNSGRLYHQETGLLFLLVLAVSAYSDGLRTGPPLTVIGVYLGLVAIASAYLDNYLGYLAILALAAAGYHYRYFTAQSSSSRL